MNTYSFDELISKQFLQVVNVEIPGVGMVKLRQLSAENAAQISREAEGLTGDELEIFICRKTAEFLKGGDVTDDEVQALRQYHTSKTISLVYTKALQSSPESVDLVSAEKN